MDSEKLAMAIGAPAVGLDDLCETVERLKAVLTPVEPSPVYRAALRQRLDRVARQERNPVQIASSDERRNEVLVGAAVLSVVGALIYLWRSHVLQDRSHASMVAKKRSGAPQLSATISGVIG